MTLRTLLLGAAAAFAIATTAQAKDITVTYNDNEQAALVQVFDIALKAQGMSVAQNVMALYQKLLAAANPPKAEDAKPAPDTPADGSPPPK